MQHCVYTQHSHNTSVAISHSAKITISTISWHSKQDPHHIYSLGTWKIFYWEKKELFCSEEGISCCSCQKMLTWVQYKVWPINPHPCLFHGTQNTKHHVTLRNKHEQVQRNEIWHIASYYGRFSIWSLPKVGPTYKGNLLYMFRRQGNKEHI